MRPFESLVESLRKRAPTLTLRSSVEDDAWPFMMNVLDLGLRLEAEPSRRAEIRGLLDETATHLDQELGIIELFADHIDSRSSFGWSEDPTMWEDLCTRRSAVAFFVELYQGTLLEPRLAFIDQAHLDEVMRDHAHHGYLRPDEIPAHMPTRHWWWWLPDDPPA